MCCLEISPTDSNESAVSTKTDWKLVRVRFLTCGTKRIARLVTVMMLSGLPQTLFLSSPMRWKSLYSRVVVLAFVQNMGACSFSNRTVTGRKSTVININSWRRPRSCTRCSSTRPGTGVGHGQLEDSSCVGVFLPTRSRGTMTSHRVLLDKFERAKAS